ncbi:MAG: 16S rRNA (cytosine(967)-C(5))-methyltransferase RsmB, partial [Gammaproteobacteria bacterium]
AAGVLCEVLGSGRSLTAALASAKIGLASSRESALLQSLCYGTLRRYFRLQFILEQLLKKPLKKKDLDIHVLALLGLYQIAYTRVKPYAAVAETVAAARHKQWAKPLLNAILRSYLRERETLDRLADHDETARSGLPAWLLNELRRCWPEQAEAICEANHLEPPMVLRVNRRRGSRDRYLQLLQSEGLAAAATEFNEDAVVLHQAVDVARLPGFDEGLVSVQDGAAQFAAYLIDAKPGQRVLDACAAPGGKTAHLLELNPSLAEMVAVDINPERASRIAQNLERLGLTARIVTADLLDFSAWWDRRLFDRILLDAPCSASGVIRRHPDIKILRRPEDLAILSDKQEKLLAACWSMLAPGGRLVYATCSVLSQENHEQIARFMKSHEDARENPIEQRWGIRCPVGRQILPGESGMDGFYYACLSRES